MKAWLGAEQFRPVSDRKQAVEMPENKAHEVMRDANRNHPERRWRAVKVPDDRTLFVVEGTPKV